MYKHRECHSKSQLTNIDHLGSIDQDGYNLLKPPIKTGGSFNHPTLFRGTVIVCARVICLPEN